LAHRDLSGIDAIGVDEIPWQRGHHYLTLVYQIEDGMKRLLWVAQDRTEESLRGFFQTIPEEVRRGEARRLAQDGYEPVLKQSRWCLLKRPENLTEKQTVKLAELLQYNLQSVRSYLLREDFQSFWEYISPGWAGKFLDPWCTRTLRSRIEPMKKVARSLRAHRDLILNWFRARGSVSAGAVEGLNNKAKLTTRKAYGFRTCEGIKTALYHALGNLPEPEFTHEFC
jgi:transposase